VKHVPRISAVVALGLEPMKLPVVADLADVFDSGCGHRNAKRLTRVSHGRLPSSRRSISSNAVLFIARFQCVTDPHAKTDRVRKFQ
jgi:hypothetical protein